MRNKFMWILVAMAGIGLSAFGAGTPDPRVAKLLEESGYTELKTDDDGDYELLLKFDDERTQLVYVISETYSLDTLEVREIWAPVCRQELTADKLRMLMEESFQSTIGFYAMAGDTLIYCARLPVGCTAQELDQVITDVAVNADEMEKLLTSGADEF